MAKRTRRQAPLTRARILTAALSVLEAEGSDAVSMRRVAEKLGVQAMSLYAHVDGKDDLLDGVVALAFSQFRPAPPGTPREKLAALAREYRSWAVARPSVFALLGSRPLPIGEHLKLFDVTVGLLREFGFEPTTAVRAFHAVGAYVFGATMAELQWNTEYRRRLAEQIGRGGTDDYPASFAAKEELTDGDRTALFEFGLAVLLDGLELAARRG
jgi:AcrR family transcriptional regulator